MAEERGPVAYFFLNPPAPFWYLPVLFLFFVLIPPAGKKGSLALIALGLCTYFICGLSAAAVLPGCVRSLLQNLIWFAMGLALANAPADLLRKKPLPLLLGAGFLLLAGITFTLLRGNRALLLLCGLLACGAVLSAMQLAPRRKTAPGAEPVQPGHLSHLSAAHHLCRTGTQFVAALWGTKPGGAHCTGAGRLFSIAHGGGSHCRTGTGVQFFSVPHPLYSKKTGSPLCCCGGAMR